MKFDHDFIGRDALEKVDPAAQRKKVTLAWDAEDLGKIVDLAAERRRTPATSSSTCRSPTTAPPTTTRSSTPDGTVVGYSMFTGYSANERRGLSLATVDPNVPEGTELKVVWGEPNGGTTQGERRAARADRGARRGQPGAVLDRRARDLPGRLAHAVPARLARRNMLEGVRGLRLPDPLAPFAGLPRRRRRHRESEVRPARSAARRPPVGL